MRQVNLLPDELKKSAKIKIITNSLVVILLPTIVVLLVLHFLMAAHVDTLSTKAAKPPRAVDTPEIIQLKDEKSSLNKQLTNLVEQDQVIINVLEKNFSVPVVLKAVSERTIERVWLNGLVLNLEKKTCQLSGRSFNTRLVSEFMLELKQLPYFAAVELISMEKDEKEVNFTIVCNFK